MGSTYKHLGGKKYKEHIGGAKRKEKKWRGILPLNTETQRIELTCIYCKLMLKTIYKSDGECDRPLISGTTTVGSNNKHTANAPRATT